MRSELDAIHAYLRAAEDLIPYCNEDARDTLGYLNAELREHLQRARAELQAQHGQLERDARRKQAMHNLRLQLLAGGKK